MCSIIYVSTTKVVQIKSLVWPWPILRQGQFGHIGFWMGKIENYLFFGNFCRLRSQSCLKHLARWVNDVEWVSKVKVIFWPWQSLNLFFAETVRRFGTKIHMKACRGTGIKILTNELGHMTNIAAMPIYSKNLKKSSSPKPINRWPWNFM